MSGILKVGDKQKFIAEKKEISSKDNVVEYEIKVNGLFKKRYTRLYIKKKPKMLRLRASVKDMLRENK